MKRLVLDPDPVGVPAPDDPPTAVGAPLTVRPALQTRHDKDKWKKKNRLEYEFVDISIFIVNYFKILFSKFHDHIQYVLAPSTSSVRYQTSRERKEYKCINNVLFKPWEIVDTCEANTI